MISFTSPHRERPLWESELAIGLRGLRSCPQGARDRPYMQAGPGSQLRSVLWVWG